MLNREKWIRGPGTSTLVKRVRLVLVHIWIQNDAGDWGWILWAVSGEKAQYV
jgi:hypothetical protein